MRVAVTGASGFVGGTIARWLAQRGYMVHSFGRRPIRALREALPDYRRWDVTTDDADLPTVDAVVHCAAHVGQWGDARPYHAVNVEGTRRVLERFAAAERVVHVSTASVYASDVAKVRVREEARVGEPALTEYARTKAMGEATVRASGRAAVILRPHIVYGAGDTTLWPRLLAARRFGCLAVPGDGTNLVSVTHVANLALAVECALRAVPHAATYNVSDGADASVAELLGTMLRRHGVPSRLIFVPRPLAWGAAMASEWLGRAARREREPTLTRYVVANLADECTLDISRARAALGYIPRHTFRDAPLG